MSRRIRNTKKLAARIDRDYFKKTYPLELWRWALTWTGVLLGLGWLGWAALNGSGRPYSAGPLARSHQSFEQNCSACHVNASGSAVTGQVTDQACSACHSGAPHNARQVFTPACASCHADHQGRAARLSATSERSCTQCHAALQTKAGAPVFAAAIERLDRGHPQLTALRQPGADLGTLKFNHQRHLKPELRGLRDATPLTCQDCHRPAGVTDTWPYALPSPMPSAATGPADRADAMQPIRYELQCAGCHPLTFDPEIPDAARHASPEIVSGVVQAKLFEYVAQHPQVVSQTARLSDPKIPRRPRSLPARNAAEWVEWRQADAELLLWKKTCPECHTLDFEPGVALPKVRPVALRDQWLEHARFSHQAHQMESCLRCHGQATRSQLTSDILLPGIENCQGCHQDGRGGGTGSVDGAAESRCSECHVYHDPKQRRLPPSR